MENYPVMTPEENPKSNPENSPGENFEKRFQKFCDDCAHKAKVSSICDACRIETFSTDEEPLWYRPNSSWLNNLEEEPEDVHIPPAGKPIHISDFYKKPKKKKLNDLDKYLILSFTCIILFTIAVLINFFITGNEPAVLVGCFFGAFGGETVICARIKKYKLHKEAELKKDDGDTFT